MMATEHDASKKEGKENDELFLFRLSHMALQPKQPQKSGRPVPADGKLRKKLRGRILCCRKFSGYEHWPKYSADGPAANAEGRKKRISPGRYAAGLVPVKP